MDFNEFDLQYGDLANEVNVYEEKGRDDYPDIPEGKYEVSLDEIKTSVSKQGNPMATFIFKIVAGDFENRKEFYNQVLTNKYGIHNCNQMLKDLCPELTQEEHLFKKHSQYAMLIDDISNMVAGKEYCLEKTKGKNDFFNYKILERY